MGKKKAKFSGHQTFAFRYGWLEKGFRFVKEGKSFGNENAIVDLGVGKNMVDSIKYWCEMTGVLSDGSVSDFGIALLDEQNGWDPFLEDNASLWLLHWNLITNPEYVSAGSALFSFLHKPEFSKREVAVVALRLLDQNKKAPSDKVILRDIDCYIRSYAGVRRFEKQKIGEESFGSPLQELELIHPMMDAEMYRFSIGSKLSLPPEIVGYAIWDYLNRGSKRDSMRIQEALYHEFSPGQVFMLDENALVEAVNMLHASTLWESKFNFIESAGVALIQCSMTEEEGLELLNYYYKRGRA